jgi:peptidoglycan/LPS O-acetylase OafA/YrhL
MKQLFQRPNNNYAYIDGIRAIAVLWVIFFHAWIWQSILAINTTKSLYDYSWLNWVPKGDLGVDLFFVISGFLIGSILFKEIATTGKINFKKFYIRRFLRLMPVYLFTMLICIYLYNDNINTFWSNLLYINNYVPNSYMLHTWSLAIEEQFYIVIPFLLLYVLPKFKNKIYFFLILTLISIGLIWYYVFVKYKFNIPFNHTIGTEDEITWFWKYYVVTHLRYIGLLSGIAVAYLNVFKPEQLKNAFQNNRILLNLALVISLILVLFISFTPLGEWMPMPSSIFSNLHPNIGRWYEILHRPVFSYAIGFIIISCIYSHTSVIKPVKKILSLQLFYPIAQLSYSAYLFHMPLMSKLYPYMFSIMKNNYSEFTIVMVNVIASLLITLIVSILMYYFIEQPFQKIRNKINFN